jgi:hypothetical protein
MTPLLSKKAVLRMTQQPGMDLLAIAQLALDKALLALSLSCQYLEGLTLKFSSITTSSLQTFPASTTTYTFSYSTAK